MTQDSPTPCRICRNHLGNRLYHPREMMFGYDETFDYLECGNCGCLQIVHIPNDLGRYYGADYYSFKPPKAKRYPKWMLALRRRRTLSLLGRSDILGKLLVAASKHRAEHFDWLTQAEVSLDSAILDVGCGSGAVLRQMQRDGFSKLLGIDPFIESDVVADDSLRILKRRIDEIQGRFDFIMLNHSFEHMPEPNLVLKQLRDRLHDNGTLMLRVPVADSYARRKYGIHWVAWDAPRHLFLYTVRSIHQLAHQVGLRVAHISYDSSRLQFYGSELYLRGIPFKDHNVYTPSNGPLAFSKKEWALFASRAAELNRDRDGDTACFYLRAA